MVRRVRWLPAALLTALLCCSVAFSQVYRVDEGGGAFGLSERIDEAAAAWNDLLSPDEQLRAGQEGVPFEYGDPELMGPDLVTLTLVGEDELRVLVQPETYEDYPAALLHELGLLLGLPVGDDGVLAPLLQPNGPARPSEADLEQLEERLSRLPGDINGDGTVDILDLAELGRSYGRRGLNLPADLDGNGTVDADDVEAMRAHYGFTPPVDLDEQETGDEDAPSGPGLDGEADEGEEAGQAVDPDQNDGPERLDGPEQPDLPGQGGDGQADETEQTDESEGQGDGGQGDGGQGDSGQGDSGQTDETE